MDKNNIKKELLKLIGFTVNGILCVAVDCAVYYILLAFTSIDFRLIQPISMSVGLYCSFVLNRHFVFKNDSKSLGKEIFRYVVVCAFVIMISPIVISFYYIWLGKYIVKIPATLTLGLINYLLNSFYVYGKMKPVRKAD